MITPCQKRTCGKGYLAGLTFGDFFCGSRFWDHYSVHTWAVHSAVYHGRQSGGPAARDTLSHTIRGRLVTGLVASTQFSGQASGKAQGDAAATLPGPLQAQH